MESSDLHARLERLGHTIAEARERMTREAHLYRDEMHLTSDEMRQRYHDLQDRLHGEAADAEAHGHHVSALEMSVRQWLDSIDEAHAFSTETSENNQPKERQDV